MGGHALETIRSQVKSQGEIPVQLELSYKVIFSTLQGNLPVNNRVRGHILDFPVNLELSYTIIPNTGGSFPVNSRIQGTIGDSEIKARMPYKMVFSTIAGNIPVNSAIQWKSNGTTHQLRMPHTLVSGGTLTGGGPAISTSGMKATKVVEVKFKGGKMIEKEPGSTADEKIPSEAGRPICTGIIGAIGDIELDLRFSFTYFCNTSTGRSPINTRLKGVLRSLPQP